MNDPDGKKREGKKKSVGSEFDWLLRRGNIYTATYLRKGEAGNRPPRKGEAGN